MLSPGPSPGPTVPAPGLSLPVLMETSFLGIQMNFSPPASAPHKSCCSSPCTFSCTTTHTHNSPDPCHLACGFSLLQSIPETPTKQPLKHSPNHGSPLPLTVRTTHKPDSRLLLLHPLILLVTLCSLLGPPGGDAVQCLLPNRAQPKHHLCQGSACSLLPEHLFLVWVCTLCMPVVPVLKYPSHQNLPP